MLRNSRRGQGTRRPKRRSNWLSGLHRAPALTAQAARAIRRVLMLSTAFRTSRPTPPSILGGLLPCLALLLVVGCGGGGTSSGPQDAASEGAGGAGGRDVGAAGAGGGDGGIDAPVDGDAAAGDGVVGAETGGTTGDGGANPDDGGGSVNDAMEGADMRPPGSDAQRDMVDAPGTCAPNGSSCAAMGDICAMPCSSFTETKCMCVPRPAGGGLWWSCNTETCQPSDASVGAGDGGMCPAPGSACMLGDTPCEFCDGSSKRRCQCIGAAGTPAWMCFSAGPC